MTLADEMGLCVAAVFGKGLVIIYIHIYIYMDVNASIPYSRSSTHAGNADWPWIFKSHHQFLPTCFGLVSSISGCSSDVLFIVNLVTPGLLPWCG
jgi:hypothetical protein